MNILHRVLASGNHWSTSKEPQQLACLYLALLISVQTDMMLGVNEWEKRYILCCITTTEVTGSSVCNLIYFLVFFLPRQYGLDTSKFTYNSSDPNRSQQSSTPSSEERGGCNILWGWLGLWELRGVVLLALPHASANNFVSNFILGLCRVPVVLNLK